MIYEQLAGALGALKQDGADLDWPALNEQMRDLGRRLGIATYGDPHTGAPPQHDADLQAEIATLHRQYRDMCLARGIVRVGELFDDRDFWPLVEPK